MVFIQQTIREYQPQILSGLFFNPDALFLSIPFDRHADAFVIRQIVIVKNIRQLMPVDRQQDIAWTYACQSCRGIGCHLFDYMGCLCCLCHSISYNSKRLYVVYFAPIVHYISHRHRETRSRYARSHRLR